MATQRSGPLSRRGFLAAAAGTAVVVALPRCTQEGEEASDGELVLRFHDRTVAPTSLDPARNVDVPLGYDVLIYETQDGTLEPQIAESWGYVGEGNTTFEVTLREGLTFSDGEPVNAEAVKANIDYRLDPSSGAARAAALLAAVTEVELVNDLTVRLHLSEPDPLMPRVFTQHYGGPGILISPAALQNPSVLATQTFGVGRYMLDPDETVFGDTYTWVRDPKYADPEAVHWDKVIVHHMPELSGALAAMRSGQIDIMRADSTVTAAGESAGFAVTPPGLAIVHGFSLIDRDGVTSPALADVRVRQGLNHAIDREKIVAALYGDSGMPIDQLSAPGKTGWNDEPYYPYDPNRAVQLFADAGYADGFSFRAIIPPDDLFVRLAEAVADDLRSVGVEMQIDAVPAEQFDQANGETNRNYGAVLLGWGIDHPYRMGRSFWLPNAPNNAFNTADETLVQLDQQLAVADEEEQADLSQEIIARVAELGWFLPVAIFGESVIYNEDVVQLEWTEFVSFPWPTEFRPAE